MPFGRSVVPVRSRSVNPALLATLRVMTARVPDWVAPARAQIVSTSPGCPTCRARLPFRAMALPAWALAFWPMTRADGPPDGQQLAAHPADPGHGSRCCRPRGSHASVGSVAHTKLDLVRSASRVPANRLVRLLAGRGHRSTGHCTPLGMSLWAWGPARAWSLHRCTLTWYRFAEAGHQWCAMSMTTRLPVPGPLRMKALIGRRARTPRPMVVYPSKEPPNAIWRKLENPATFTSSSLLAGV